MSTTFRVVRDVPAATQGPTMGQLFTDEDTFQTLEPPWLGNRAFESCIPVGTYRVVMIQSHKFGRFMPELQDVSDRSDIEIHPLNTVHETHGCIGIGFRRGGAAAGVPGGGSELAYPTRPASDRFNQWLSERLLEGPVFCEVSYADGSVPE